MMVEALSECGYRVLAAESGRQAMKMAAGCMERIDLLLTDIVMRQMSGPELWERLAPQCPGMRLLCVSGHSERESPEGAVLLKKPFSPDTPAETVRSVLDAPATV